jgi:hypothetical protein
MARWLLIGMILGLAGASGCTSELEDGYKPTPLGSSDAVRRSYYANPFTPEARVTPADRDQELDARRPRPGY